MGATMGAPAGCWIGLAVPLLPIGMSAWMLF
jgi:hypothetical protein